MFTGIIEEIGEIAAIEPSGDGVRLSVIAPRAVEGVRHGDSIAVSGVCLTVVAWDARGFTADVMRQTLDMSTLGLLAPGSRVNIERATAAGGRLGGHIVQGHIDGTGTVAEVRPGAQWRVIRVGMPAHLAPLVVDKGSIAVDGTSLTVSAVSPAGAAAPWFEVSLIPETLQATTLGALAPGHAVNLETDILARHVQRLMAFRAAPAPAPDPTWRRPDSAFSTTDVPPADYSILSAPFEGGSR